ncbi:MAG: OmpH family outer membrane protein [Candidatus Desulfofervidaceae bacterium]|nr:OmpH family outer membrane protein [Candidatus Desulfofervidaceae bacterium]MDL1970606.1 OmpH family outer membrane protein [Candidatus Desulfofervidaceae bacterium]
MKKMVILGSLCCWLFLLMAVPLQAGEMKIAIVDLQKALNLCEAGKAAKAKLTKKFEKFKKDLDTRQKELEDLKKELEKQSLMLSLEAKRDKEKEYERKLRDFKDTYQDYKEEMKRAEYEAIQPILQDLHRVTEKIRKKEGYLLVFEKNSAGIVCYENKIDITNKVVQLYNKEWKNKQKKAK